MEGQEQEIRMDSANLYREEAFTDRQVGSITRLTPVDGEGNTDPSRKVVYLGQTQVMTQAGALPIHFELEVQSLQEAAEQFGTAAQKAVEDTMNRIRELQRESASSIITPDQAGGQGGFGGGGGGTGGGFQLR